MCFGPPGPDISTLTNEHQKIFTASWLLIFSAGEKQVFPFHFLRPGIAVE